MTNPETELADYVAALPPLITREQALEWAQLAGALSTMTALDSERARGRVKSHKTGEHRGAPVRIKKAEFARYLERVWGQA